MAKFNVKWASGKELSVEQSDCQTVDQFINTYFGRNADVKAFGAKVTLVEEAKEEMPVAKTIVPVKEPVKAKVEHPVKK